MATSTASAGSQGSGATLKNELYGSISRLVGWLERSDYRGYDTFDGLNARFLRPLTFENPLLRTALLQGVRRFPINLRPILGISKSHSSKAMGFLARGFIRLYQATGASQWREKAMTTFKWLVENPSPGYSGACWGNHFDYQSRSGFAPKGLPSVVWTSLIGHALLDAHEHFGEGRLLDVAVSSCEHILRDLDKIGDEDRVCIDYFPGRRLLVHNANALAASLLARTYSRTGNDSYRRLAQKAIRYTAEHQKADGSWYYGEAANLHWTDNFHTAYVLDSFKHYIDSTGDPCFRQQLANGYEYWKRTFFLADGTPRYYSHKTFPIDIQCCSQAIDTFVLFADHDPEAPALATTVAKWTIENMQDQTGYFYYRRYGRWLVNKTATLHWGQATMLCALAGLYRLLIGKREAADGH